jgi:dTMP kinase
LSPDIRESFRIFQGRVMQQYDQMSKEFGFIEVDATLNIHEQQQVVRRIFAERIDLDRFQQRRMK